MNILNKFLTFFKSKKEIIPPQEEKEYRFDSPDLTWDELNQLNEDRFNEVLDRLNALRITNGPENGIMFGSPKREDVIMDNFHWSWLLTIHLKNMTLIKESAGDEKKIKLVKNLLGMNSDIESQYQYCISGVETLERRFSEYEQEQEEIQLKKEKIEDLKKDKELVKEAYEEAKKEYLEEMRAAEFAHEFANIVKDGSYNPKSQNEVEEENKRKRQKEKNQFYSDWNAFLDDREPSQELLKDYLSTTYGIDEVSEEILKRVKF